MIQVYDGDGVDRSQVVLGEVVFHGADGTDFRSVPGTTVISTSFGGRTTEVMRILPNGDVVLGSGVRGGRGATP